MSGGSYGYLFINDLVPLKESVIQMRDRLQELAPHSVATLQTAQVVALMGMIEILQNQLGGVWRAVEWLDSFDNSVESTMAVINEYTKGIAP